MSSLFITGASGFIGRNILLQLDFSKYVHVFCLSRSPNTIIEKNNTDNIHIIQGDISDSERYAPYLTECDTVIHMAAATGKVYPEDYFNVNTKGTQVLIDQCGKSDIRNFLHVSTIAVKYTNQQKYYYAQSKKLAEQYVKNSNMSYVIVRPTIVIGKDSVVWNSLYKLAISPIVPIFGDGKVKIQPIYIDDLVSCLLNIVYEKRFDNKIYELGGPELICFGDFLKKIHDVHHGKSGMVVHIPLWPLIPILSMMENLIYSLLPINVGQLSPFQNDSTVEMNDLFMRHVHNMKNLDEMLSLVVYDT